MGFHVQKYDVLIGFENIFRLNNIISIQSHLSKKDEAIIQKGEYYTII